jgi:hypothetical protein
MDALSGQIDRSMTDTTQSSKPAEDRSSDTSIQDARIDDPIMVAPIECKLAHRAHQVSASWWLDRPLL